MAMQTSRARTFHAAVCGLSVQENDPDNHDIPGFQKIVLKGIDDCLLSLRQQIQHDVVIILMVLGHPREVTYGVAILAMKRRLSGLQIPFCQLPIT